MSVKQVVMAAAGALGGEKAYIEDVFSTYLYTGNGSTQTITNGIDLAGEGGLVWIKARSNAYNNNLFDTERGIGYRLNSNTTNAEVLEPFGTVSSTGFAFTTGLTGYNNSGTTFASWTFRKAPKFFDVVTYTGNGTAGRTVAHNLGSVPGCIIVKRYDASGYAWPVYHRSLGATKYLSLDGTTAEQTSSTRWNDTEPTSTEFTLGSGSSTNASGGSYVAYLFAHDAGGFGDAGDQSVIKCGSFTTDTNGNATVTLGWEPQLVLFKASSDIGNWFLEDTMRGMTVGTDYDVYPNLSAAESSVSDRISPTATGFTSGGSNAGSTTFIYIAIRRGPMKTPTDGTSVFDDQLRSSVNSVGIESFAVTTDSYLQVNRTGTAIKGWFPRLTSLGLLTHSSSSESSAGTLTANFGISPQTSVECPVLGGTSTTAVMYGFTRAPGFFDVVCYTGNGVSGQGFSHGLTVVPEMVIYKCRSNASNWIVWHKDLGTGASGEYNLYLNTTGAKDDSGNVPTAPTASYFYGGPYTPTNGNTYTYVAYLFASCPGVSKVGSYTGTGTTLQINCGFSAGARFVLIKRTDSTGDWYVWDSARGIVAGNDPYLLLNSTAAEVTSTDYIDPLASGFEISSTAPAAINASGGSFIYLAIA